MGYGANEDMVDLSFCGLVMGLMEELSQSNS